MNGNRKRRLLDTRATAGINPAARCLVPGPRPLAPGPRSRGFTLVELLVVITIIAVLTGLITAAAIMARKTAMSARMKIEVMSMDQALNAFKDQFGAYPPDGTNQPALQQFVANAFPRYTGTGLPSTIGGQSFTLSPSNALSFWLGGIQFSSSPPTGYSINQPAGFSTNPLNPFDSNASRTGPFFNFDTSRLTNGTAGTTGYVYFPNNGLSANSGVAPPHEFALLLLLCPERHLHHHGFRPPALHVQCQRSGIRQLGRDVCEPQQFPDPLPRPGRRVRHLQPVSSDVRRQLAGVGKPVGRHHQFHQGGHDEGRHAGLGLRMKDEG